MSDVGLSLSPSFFPAQKVSDSKKNEKFFKECIEAGVNITYWNINNLNNVRQSRKNKIVNYNLYNDIIDKSEIERVVNPFRFEDKYFPATYKNYPILTANINVLLGEERKRIFNPIVTVINEDVINSKLESMNNDFIGFMIQAVLDPNMDEEFIKAKLEDLNKIKYTYRDRRERMVHQVIEYGYRQLYMKDIFSRCYEDLLISSEEIAVVDVYGGEPVLRKGNPLNFYTLRSGDSPFIEDSDIIIEDGYYPVGEVIDRYYDELTPKDIDDLETGTTINKGGMFQTAHIMNRPSSIGEHLSISSNNESVLDSFKTNRDTTFFYGGYFDAEGNVRVTRVVWRSMRKIGELTYFDENGDLVKKYVPEQYKPNKEAGEDVKWIWVTDWLEGTKIGYDKYVRCRPVPFQMRKMDNPSMSKPGIVGVMNNINSSRGKSLIDSGKDYQYLFNAFMHRLEMLYIKSKGKIGKLPLHLIPDKWTVDQAMYYAEMLGWLPVDMFNESNRPSSMGKPAGMMQEGNSVIDLEMGNSIQQTYLMLDFIKRNLDDLMGITPQRRGAIDNRETVGGVTTAVQQSSLSTEKWFSVHENFKLRCLKAYVEAVKYAWRGKSFKKQYYLDDGSMAILDFDGDVFAESEYGIDISTALNDQEMMQMLRGNVQSLMQNGTPTSMIMKLYRINDPATLQREIEAMEAQQQQAQQQEMQSQQQQIQMQMQQAQEIADREYQLEIERMDRDDTNKQLDRENDIYLAEIKALGFSKNTDADMNGVPDVMEQARLALDETKASYEHNFKKKELDDKKSIEDKKLKLEEMRMKHEKELQVIKDKNAMEREKLKARTSLKNKTSSGK